MASIDNLLADITHCALLAECKGGGGGPCSTIVAVQDDVSLEQHQVPEPWTGRLDLARIVFVGSNPSIDPLEDYPGWGDDPEAIRAYFVERFDGGPGQIKDGRYSPSRDGGWGGAVRFWSSVRQRAFELLPDAVPGLDYALTEVVHCKSRGGDRGRRGSVHLRGALFPVNRRARDVGRRICGVRRPRCAGYLGFVQHRARFRAAVGGDRGRGQAPLRRLPRPSRGRRRYQAATDRPDRIGLRDGSSSRRR
ncbi:hypothetical protein [Prescottella equi]|uniref:hypothetical protein n=1 Tax=Rhodococcus hoagii TaxID=43767 RepID=UPI001E2BAF97|nr:hypothetical protein [Prescottella equi]